MNVALIRLSDAAPGSALYTGLPYTGRRDEHVSVRVNPDFRAVYEFGAKKCSPTTIGREILAQRLADLCPGSAHVIGVGPDDQLAGADEAGQRTAVLDPVAEVGEDSVLTCAAR